MLTNINSRFSHFLNFTIVSLYARICSIMLVQLTITLIPRNDVGKIIQIAWDVLSSHINFFNEISYLWTRVKLNCWMNINHDFHQLTVRENVKWNKNSFDRYATVYIKVQQTNARIPLFTSAKLSFWKVIFFPKDILCWLKS